MSIVVNIFFSILFINTANRLAMTIILFIDKIENKNNILLLINNISNNIINIFNTMLNINIHGPCYLVRKNKCNQVQSIISAMIDSGIVLSINEHYYIAVDKKENQQTIKNMIKTEPIVYYTYMNVRLELRFCESDIYTVSFDHMVTLQDLDTGEIITFPSDTYAKISVAKSIEYKKKLSALFKIEKCPVAHITFNEKISVMNHYKKNNMGELNYNIRKWANGHIDPEYISISISLYSDFVLASCLHVKNSQQNVSKIIDLMRIKLKSLDTELADLMLASATNNVINNNSDNSHLTRRFTEVNSIRKFINTQYERLENFVSVELFYD